MKALTAKPRQTLERDGFCYNSLKALETLCAEALNADGCEPADRVALFVIGRICFSVAERLEAEPSSTFHHRQENAIRPALVKAIDCLESDHSKEKIQPLDQLILAYRNS